MAAASHLPPTPPPAATKEPGGEEDVAAALLTVDWMEVQETEMACAVAFFWSGIGAGIRENFIGEKKTKNPIIAFLG
jgi:hypothetical protein